jgi:hydrophobic/amphiphilic exporter-1 (mainly G- bacteria), HAE1 family
MKVAQLFVRRHLMTTVVILGILLFGVAGYRRRSLIELGNTDFSIIVVSAVLPGASTEIMESSVTTPLEQQFLPLTGLDTMTSVNLVGSTEIALQFNPSRDIDTAAQDVQAAILRTLPQLPPGMPNPPSCRKSKRADLPVLDLLATIDKSVESVITQTGASARDSVQV